MILEIDTIDDEFDRKEFNEVEFQSLPTPDFNEELGSAIDVEASLIASRMRN